MKRFGILYFIFFIGALEMYAQQPDYMVASGLNVTAMTANSDTTDTSEIPQGIIYVRKATIIPYVQVQYKYYLAHVNMVKVNRIGASGYEETENVPTFDSTVYSRLLKRQYPKKAEGPLLSKMFVENMKYLYSASDTPRADTMVIGLWIDANGKIRYVLDDPEYTLQMPDQMVNELTRASQKLYGTMWGEKGGYFQRKKMFRPAPLVLESYYCEMFVIVSSYPMTVEQKISRYAPFDYPLNSPPTDAQQKASKEKNDKVTPKR
jgi:hypothetical protein